MSVQPSVKKMGPTISIGECPVSLIGSERVTKKPWPLIERSAPLPPTPFSSRLDCNKNKVFRCMDGPY